MAKNLFLEIQEIKNTDTISFVPNLPIVAELQLKGLREVHHLLKKPFDENLSFILERTARRIMEQHSPCIIAHSFSNEITLVMHSKDNNKNKDSNHRDNKNQNSKLALVTKLVSFATSCFEEEKRLIKESDASLPAEFLNKIFQFSGNCWNVPKTIKAVEWLMIKENRARHIAAAKICNELKIDTEDQNTKSLIDSLAREGIVLEQTYGEYVYRGSFQKKRKNEDGSKVIEKLKIPPIHMIYNKLGVFFGNEVPLIIEPNKVAKKTSKKK